ncbi:MAG TPA: ATP-binding protein, partial [Brevundimonas sp.]|nr:ATP-binding protein [Brevundimonas sp.]
MRDLYRQQERLRLVETIATAANDEEDPAVAFGRALKEICIYTGWSTGHVFMFADDDMSCLRSSGVWYGGDDLRQAPFRDATTAAVFPAGVGLPGRVLESGRAVWVEDVTIDSNFPRAPAAASSNLHGAFAFPALIGDQVGAVLEFFQNHPAPPDPELLETLNKIGAQLGRVVERHRSGRRLRIHNETLAALYAEAQAQKEAAEAANRTKSAFLAVTSHEVRTPLNAVLGLSEALKRENLTLHQKELNDGVLASGEMLLRLLNAVLDMSRIEADQATVRLSEFDIAEKARAIISIWTPRARELGVALSLDDSKLKLARICSDEGRVEQTLVNLISNALKFTPAGGEVSVVVSGTRRKLRLEVIDGGPGVPEADRERIFMPFEQTEAGRAAGGAGLGLSICTGNVRLLNGEIGTDRTGAGASRFWFECPVLAASTPMAAPAIDRLPQAGLRVLAAEDNPA